METFNYLSTRLLLTSAFKLKQVGSTMQLLNLESSAIVSVSSEGNLVIDIMAAVRVKFLSR